MKFWVGEQKMLGTTDLEHVMHEALEGVEYIGASINGNMVNNLHFADNIDLIARQLGDLQHLLNKAEEVSTCCGLEISETKTEWLIMRHEDSINTSRKQLTSLPWCYNNKQ